MADHMADSITDKAPQLAFRLQPDKQSNATAASPLNSGHSVCADYRASNWSRIN
tara:strand:+ start:140 stop:301 length:162 start_codon:yes stop_codon:yes gene_type:complete